MLEGGGTGGGQASSEDAIKNAYQGGYGGAQGAAGQVYFGMGQPGEIQGNLTGEQHLPRVPQYLSKTQAYNFINNLSGKQMSDLQAKMVYGGLISEKDGLIEMQAKWKKLVDAAYGLNQAGQLITPFDVLSSYLGAGPLGGKGGLGPLGSAGGVWRTEYRGGRKFLVNSQTGQVQYQGPRFQTTYQKSLDLTDPTTAKAIATSVFQQLMHRDPGRGELGGYADALRTAEQQSPVTSSTTTEFDPNTGEAIGQSTKTSGGLSAEARQYLAEKRVKGTKEYASVQAATTYMNALEAAIFNNPFGSI